MRCFVAVWPPEDVLDALAALPKPAVNYARWSTRDQWHVTLRFLGELDDTGVVGAIEALEEAARSLAHLPAGPPGPSPALSPGPSPALSPRPSPALSPGPSPLRPFVARGGPRTRFMGPGLVVWPVEGLDEVAQVIERATAKIGEPVGRRRFRGHVTVARARGGADLRRTGLQGAGFAQAADSAASQLLAPLERSWAVSSFSLVESRLRAGGSAYTNVATFSVGPSR